MNKKLFITLIAFLAVYYSTWISPVSQPVVTQVRVPQKFFALDCDSDEVIAVVKKAVHKQLETILPKNYLLYVKDIDIKSIGLDSRDHRNEENNCKATVDVKVGKGRSADASIIYKVKASIGNSVWVRVKFHDSYARIPWAVMVEMKVTYPDIGGPENLYLYAVLGFSSENNSYWEATELFEVR